MRLGVVLQAPWPEDAVLVEELGFDLGWIDQSSALAPLVVAAGVAPRTSAIRVVACVDAGVHPVALAEEAAVADLALGGRLVLAVRSDDEAELRETVEVLFHAFAARPFSHRGARWHAPAHLPEHPHGEERMRVTPPPAQLEPTIWLCGSAASAVARESGLACVVERDPPPAAAGLVSLRARRPRIVPVDAGPDGALDVAGLVACLRGARDAWGMDVGVLALPAGLEPPARLRALHAVAKAVRPRVQLDRLPPGLEQHWDDTLSHE